ncbi:MAG: ABC transporter ATP-binding protein [Candidatus Competibacteraceae bacterium]
MPEPSPSAPILQVKDLRIRFHSRHSVEPAVDGVGFALHAGETLAIVGESGSGKSVTALALTRLLPSPPQCRIDGSILYRGRDTLTSTASELRTLRGRQIAYIFQEPSASLNPVFSIGEQIAEAIRLHFPDVRNPKERVIAALARVGIHQPEQRYRDYPHQLSGGMNQRVMIAMALACEPQILVADEPTTALDVTIQAEIMALLGRLKQESQMAIILITHNFGIVKGFADRVAVMFRGRIVETGPTATVLEHPRHPYTRALLACIPRLGDRRRRLATIDYAALDA